MYMGVYHFTGDTAQLLEGHQRMLELLPPGVLKIHICLATESGISVYDTCPDREVFDRFSQGSGFAELVAAAGLPAPTVVPLGTVDSYEVHTT
ncbi:hypothetical protein [Arthrobacter sp. 35W]|uniref:hypothetical protein n=1 Tax=Arthrobacter sp. 35W TaxID=1132441 RepID=UPI000405B439|nr:hypothetical protein [Arthrobacter sp. 35W]